MNQTRQDAIDRINSARGGSLVEASNIYLEQLIQEVHDWLVILDAELQRRRVEEARRKRDAEITE